MKTCEYGVYNPTIDEIEPCGNLCEGSTDMCASHNAFFRKLEKQNLKAQEKRNTLIAKQRAKNQVPRAKISKVSDKQKSLNEQYKEQRKNFLNNLENKQCPIYPGYQVSEIHHKKGRIGYADDWAREHKIPLLLDERFWLAVSSAGHAFIETHPFLAKENGWSLSRHEILDQEREII